MCYESGFEHVLCFGSEISCRLIAGPDSLVCWLEFQQGDS